MIIEFHVKNYRSFREEQTLSLVASNYDKSLPQNLISCDLPGVSDLQVVKAIALYGPNAGGKTNLIVALLVLRRLVIDSAAGQKPDARLPADTFRLDRESSAEPVVFELTFIAEGVRYELAVAFTGQRIIQERLVAYPKGRAQIWYDRTWDDENNRYDWEPEKSNEFERDPGIVAKTRENSLFLSTAAQWNDARIAPVYAWFRKKLKFLSLGANNLLSHAITASLLTHSDEVRDFIKKALRSADLGLTDVEAVEQEADSRLEKLFDSMRNLIDEAGIPAASIPESTWQVAFEHQGKGGERFPMNWSNESEGTKRFFSVLGPWLEIVEYDTVLCVDELDTSLHPMLTAELLRLLFNGKTHSQLLFTTHNPLLLDKALLRRDQIWFADKNQTGESFLYPLTDYKVRADESLVRGYLSGRYGAVPFIPHGLVEDMKPDTKVMEAVDAG